MHEPFLKYSKALSVALEVSLSTDSVRSVFKYIIYAKLMSTSSLLKIFGLPRLHMQNYFQASNSHNFLLFDFQNLSRTFYDFWDAKGYQVSWCKKRGWGGNGFLWCKEIS